jgi:hypothetical protein
MMMMGIGMPMSQRSAERMMFSSYPPCLELGNKEIVPSSDALLAGR